MATANIQVPVDIALKQKAAKRAAEFGFSSIQDMIRFLLKGVAEKRFDLGVIPTKKEENVEYLTDEEFEVLEKRWKETKEAERKGEIYTARSVEEMMNILNNTKID